MKIDEGNVIVESKTSNDTTKSPVVKFDVMPLSKKFVPNKFSLKVLLIFNFFAPFATKELQPFIAVYMVVIRGWNPLQAGTLWTIRECVQILIQSPIGAFIDVTVHKRTLMCVGLFMCFSATAIFLVTDNFYIHVANAFIQGISFSIIDPCTASLTLGIAGFSDFDKTSTNNMVAHHGGTLIVAGGAGVFSYFIYPHVEYTFLISVISGIISFICILVIPSNSIDHDVARNALIISKIMNPNVSVNMAKRVSLISRSMSTRHILDVEAIDKNNTVIVGKKKKRDPRTLGYLRF